MTAWWGERSLDDGQVACVGVGPFDLWIEHAGREWRSAITKSERADAHVTSEWPCEARDLLEMEDVSRAVMAESEPKAAIKPALADRPVVTRPQHEFVVPAGVDVTIYVRSPVWIQLWVGNRAPVLVRDVPIVRPSDTWFGPMIGEGELCYAARTNCHLDPSRIQPRPFRATTAVTLKNETDTSLTIDRLKLPVQELALYAAEDGRLWTQDAVLTRENGDEFARFDTVKGTPKQAIGAPVAGPRELPTNPIIRAFGSLLG